MNDENGDMVTQSACRRTGAVCSLERSEDIEVNGQSLTAYFCSKSDDDDDTTDETEDTVEEDADADFDIRARVCERSREGHRRGRSGGRRGQGRQQNSWF